jgi:cytochrome c
MKKLFVICVSAVALYACGGSNNQPVKNDSVAAALKPDLSDNPVYKKGLALIGGSDCLTCHKIDEMLTGPAYRDVANKYPNDDSTVNRLAAKIIAGGRGVWGTVPMTPHPTISVDDAKAMVQYIMLLKKS